MSHTLFNGQTGEIIGKCDGAEYLENSRGFSRGIVPLGWVKSSALLPAFQHLPASTPIWAGRVA